MLMSSWFAE